MYRSRYDLRMKSGIYAITHRATGRKYVGSTVNRVKRWSQHRARLRRGRHHSKPLQNAWTKYGEAAFLFELIELVDDPAKLIEREQFWIDALQARGHGYNVGPVAGSPLGVRQSAETKAKKSAAGRGRKLSPEHVALIKVRAKAASLVHLHSPEARAKAGAKNRGRKRSESAVSRTAAARIGMKFPPEWCAAIGAAQRGKKRGPFSPAHKAKLSAARMGHSPTAETREKLSASATLRGAPKLTREAIDRGAAKRTGAKRTPEQRARMRAGRARNVRPKVKHSPERVAKAAAAKARNKALRQG